ncbi:MAG: Stp1/IreP family PP2C-type Ser/Thr phosphatase [Candidatus Obscuribacterales bacterium]|nr:Stp1/IreP family PP2C-type Ser/Thr phosphatase [Candidatus Obscuribacterales bacterium]
MLKWRVAQKTHEGKQRPKNEDNCYVSPDERVFVVADGMGGALGGARASKLTIDAIEQLWKDHRPHSNDSEQIKQWLKEAVGLANRSVFSTAEQDVSVRGMGTTVVVAVQSEDNHMHIAHVGDSRAYLVRQDKSMLLTQDHSVVQEMVRAGRLTEEQARINPYKNLITRCLGHDDKVEVELTPVEIKPDDWVVLCTDGLPTVLRDEQIGSLVNNQKDPEGACGELVNQTLEGGAPDNVTVVVVKYFESENGDAD